MISVRSHSEAARTFGRLGFAMRGVRQLSPMGGADAGGEGGSNVVLLHPVTSGAANYLELTYFDAKHAADFMKPILDGVQGGAMLVHVTDDAVALHQQWTARGLDLLPLVKLNLSASAKGIGQTIKIIIPQGSQPIWCNAVQYESISEFTDEELMNHPNGAISWRGVVIVVSETQLMCASEHLQRVYGIAPDESDGQARFQPNVNTIDLVLPEVFKSKFGRSIAPSVSNKPKIALVTIQVRSLERTRDFLRSNDVDLQKSAGSLLADADGLILRFVEHD